MKSTIAKLTLASVFALITFVVPILLLDTKTCVWMVRYVSYWGISGVFLCFLFFLYSCVRSRVKWRFLLRVHALGIVVVLGCSYFLHLHEKREHKILFDEYAIAATAMSFHYHRDAYVPAVVHRINDRMERMLGFVDKRPVFFPYVLSLVHTFTGYRTENVFFLNFGLTVLFLALLYSFVTRLSTSRYGVFSVLLMTTLPLLSQNTNGGGYEIMNLCLILTLMLSGGHYLNSKGGGGLNLMIVSAVLLANTRYESILYLVVPVVFAIVKWSRERSISLTWFSVFSPLFVLLPLLSNRVFNSNAGFFDNRKEDYFGLVHLKSNVAAAVVYLFDFEGAYTNSLLISMAGVISVLFALIYLVKSFKRIVVQETELLVYYHFLGIISVITLLILCLFWGEWTDFATTRFSLPLHLIFVISVSVTLYFGFQIKRLYRILWLIPFLYALTISASISARSILRTELVAKSSYGWMLEYVRQELNPEDCLFVSDSSICFILKGYAAVSMDHFNLVPERMLQLRALRAYREIYVTQLIRLDPLYGNEVDKSITPLNSRCILETVSEHVIRPNFAYRISRIIGLEPAGSSDVATWEENLPPLPPAEGYSEKEYNRYVYQLYLVGAFTQENESSEPIMTMESDELDSSGSEDGHFQKK